MLSLFNTGDSNDLITCVIFWKIIVHEWYQITPCFTYLSKNNKHKKFQLISCNLISFIWNFALISYWINQRMLKTYPGYKIKILSVLFIMARRYHTMDSTIFKNSVYVTQKNIKSSTFQSYNTVQLIKVIIYFIGSYYLLYT